MSATLPLRRGMTNGAVAEWQRKLNALRIAVNATVYQPLKVDSEFGKYTQAATDVAQALLKVPRTGQVDQATLDAVNNALKSDAPTPPMSSMVIAPSADSIVRNYFNSNGVAKYLRHTPSDSLDGIGKNGVHFAMPLNTNGTSPFIDIESDDDIDSDGPSSSHVTDPTSDKKTSLRWPDNTSCDSYAFCGFVLPEHWFQQFGVKLGDYGLVYYKGLWAPAQFYDEGPSRKIGETSVATTKALKQPASPITGNSITTLRTIAFPGSGPGHAVDAATQRAEVEKLVGRLA